MNTAIETNDTPKQKSVIEVTVDTTDKFTSMDICHSTLVLSFINGQKIHVDTAALPPNIICQAIAHGLKQKLVDAAAISRDPENGRAATPDTKYNAVLEVATRLTLGEWNKRREGGGQSGGLLYRALCIIYADKTPEQIKDWLDNKTDKQKAAMRANAKIAAEIEKLRVSDGDANRGDDLLAELDAI
jgi:hypothetical protein